MAVKTSQLLLGIEQVEARLDRLGDAADDLRDVWEPLGDLWASRMDTVFDSNGLGTWAPEAAVTIAGNQSPLVDTGVMRDGLTMDRPIWSAKQAAAYGADKSDRRVMNIAVLHNAGTSRMPKRVVVPRLRAAEKRAWMAVVQKHMARALSE
jgi:hypothetical protein